MTAEIIPFPKGTWPAAWQRGAVAHTRQTVIAPPASYDAVGLDGARPGNPEVTRDDPPALPLRLSRAPYLPPMPVEGFEDTFVPFDARQAPRSVMPWFLVLLGAGAVIAGIVSLIPLVAPS